MFLFGADSLGHVVALPSFRRAPAFARGRHFLKTNVCLVYETIKYVYLITG